MLFNSIEFFIFFFIVFCLYWFVFNKSLRGQNSLLLFSSYLFYGWWDWRFVFLLGFSTLLDYYTGWKIHNSENDRTRRAWLSISVGTNLGFLGFFKYYNFFIGSFSQGLNSLGIVSDFWTLNIILPVGISFYTFHGLSYVFDIYNRKISPVNNWVDYSVFVSFFPLLVAGPIERATHLLPQVQGPRKFTLDLATDGLRQILWGFFKKVAVADGCAFFVNDIFENHSSYSGTTLAVGATLFAFQIYGDFSGYSDIALGTAKLLGFSLIQNFAFPYFSRDIAEFWRKWHISLTTWFRDYLYIPLGGSQGGTWLKIRNTFIIFLISGLWHGANWTFIVWGAINAIFFLPLLLIGQHRKHLDTIAPHSFHPSIKDLIQMLFTFCLTCFAWIFFRSENLSEAIQYVSKMFTWPFIMPSEFYEISNGYSLYALTIKIGLLLILEWMNRGKLHGLQINSYNKFLRWMLYIVLSLIILSSAQYHNPQKFIYFQF